MSTIKQDGSANSCKHQWQFFTKTDRTVFETGAFEITHILRGCIYCGIAEVVDLPQRCYSYHVTNGEKDVKGS